MRGSGNNTGSGEGCFNNGPDEVLDLLKTFYEPSFDQEMQGFDDFFAGIESKIKKQDPVHRISEINNEIESNIINREQKLIRCIRKLEEKQKPTEANPAKVEVKVQKTNHFIKPLAITGAILLLITLGSIASLRSFRAYNFKGINQEGINWEDLELSNHQKAEILEIEKAYNEFTAHQEALIQKKKERLIVELQKEKPDMSLVDKYQRDIIDHEVALKYEKLNSFLEKRFVLDEIQGLKLVKAVYQEE